MQEGTFFYSSKSGGSFGKTMETSNNHGPKQLPFTLKRFHISEEYGFILPNPLQELPPFYGPWMEIARQLPDLIEDHELRSCVDKMPLLSSQYLQGYRELVLAHLVLSSITMGYVWQEGEKGVAKILPRNLAIPFWEISQTLGVPPILLHMDFILVNWKKKDPYGPLEIENLDPIVHLPGGEASRGFMLISFLVENAAAPGIKAVAQAINGLLLFDNNMLEEALRELTNTFKAMMTTLKKIHDHVDPAVFYGVTRIFFSGWKDSPVLPDGLIYEGVSEKPLLYSGGSAAQSTTLHAFDELLGIQHCKESTAFLQRMREYMPRDHRAFIEEMQSLPPLRCHVVSCGSAVLRSAYNECVAALSELRTYHLTVVTKYVIIASHKAKGKPSAPGSVHTLSFLDETGTGGSRIASFLKSTRDAARKAVIMS
nr:PREDICTED: indoleamine 2,3-dioxygenase 2 [Anolis carolinensis]|eukprot:XP_003226894.2 PREDICTED: indoleamine 2,3-dioxygenase 2 [Anolis carolinensis]